MDLSRLSKSYQDRLPLYTAFTKKLKLLVEEILHQHEFVFLLESRTKELTDLLDKSIREDKAYSDPLTEITDISGLRIILPKLSDVPHVTEMLQSEFEVDTENSIDKTTELQIDQFGYASIHLVVSLNPERQTLTEWKDFVELKAEIQIRTVLQHAWATISHQFDYKTTQDVPRELRRSLFRINALLEIADEQLNEFAGEIKVQTDEYRSMLQKGHDELPINVDSIKTFIESSEEYQLLIEHVRKIVGVKIDGWGNLSRDVKLCEYCDYQYIADLTNMIEDSNSWMTDFFDHFYKDFFAFTGSKAEDTRTVWNGPLTLSIIAVNSHKFDKMTLDKDFSFRMTFILDVAAMYK